ncbi:hypothetical protein pA_gene0008 [Vibrio phage 13VT501A]|nr:hypothetical protein pA_gene0008 [Vibrio phage 13VT501A]
MKVSNDAKYKVYGDLTKRGKCPGEDSVHVGFIAWIRHRHADIGALLIHPKNEGKRTAQQASMDKKMGSITKGASDIIIPGNPAFVCELKRDDPTLCKWQAGQEDYLNNAAEHGCFACVAFGLDAAKQAFEDWLLTTPKQ